MKAVYEASDRIEARLLADMLEANRIRSFIQGDYLAGGAGELPTLQFPVIWVMDDRDVALARKLIDGYFESVGSSTGPWTCPNCGESLDGNFQQCWQCGHLRDDPD